MVDTRIPALPPTASRLSVRRLVATLIVGAGLMSMAACGGSDSASEQRPASQSIAADADCIPTPDTTLGEAGAFVHVTGELGAEPKITAVCDASVALKLAAYDIVKGTGKAVAEGGVVTANYVGYGLTTRTVFDSSWPNQKPIQFSLAGVIAGWSVGLPGMKEGGRRVLVIPGSLAYGQMPPTDAIKPNETLVFVVDLVSTP